MTSKQKPQGVYGLRDVGAFKLYEKRANGTVDIFISRQVSSMKLQRVKVTRADAERINGLRHADFVNECQQRIEGAKRAGSPNYFES